MQNNKQHLSVSTIIVTYNSAAHISACLSSLEEHPSHRFNEIILIDNASKDKTPELLTESSHITCLNDTNVGFAAAANQGAKLASGHYLLFLNPDLMVQDDIVTTLRDFLAQHPKAGAVGPCLRYADGSLQPSRGSYPNLMTSLAYIFQLKRLMPSDEKVIKYGSRLLGKSFAQYKPLRPVEVVDYLTGAALMVRRELYEQLGGFDTRFFMYYEDADLCLQLREMGYLTYYLSEISAVHHVGGSSPPDSPLPRKRRIESMIKYFEKHHAPWKAKLLKIFAS